MDADRWVERFERESALGRAKLLGGTAVRLTASLIDRTLERAATTVAEAERAFKRELDPNMEEAKILEERASRRAEGTRNRGDDEPGGR